MQSVPRQTRFLAIACALGVEPWLKAEIAREHPSLQPAFSRPGLVTFKQVGETIEPGAVRSVFARVVAESSGSLMEAKAVGSHLLVQGQNHGVPLRLQVHEGPLRPSEERAKNLTPAEREALPAKVRAEWETAILSAVAMEGVDLPPGYVASPGDRVVDVFTAPYEPMWIAEHVHAAPMQPWPIRSSPVTLPEDAPSRAYLKIEEAIRWAGLSLHAGQLAVEVGSAPGGASLALLRRGVNVIGVDPGAMAPQVLAFDGGTTWFRHLKVPVGALSKGDLPNDVDWLAVDMNLAPPIALRYVERIVGPRRGRLRGAILTLKMNDAEMAAKIPYFLEQVRKMGFTSVVATQLPSNRREICVVALNPVERTGRASPGSSRAKPAKKGQAKKAQPKKGSPKPKVSRRGSSEPTST